MDVKEDDMDVGEFNQVRNAVEDVRLVTCKCNAGAHQTSTRCPIPSTQRCNTSIHFTDEGRGVPVVFMHAAFHNLRCWDAVVHRLVPNMRIVRFDIPHAGLSGPHPLGEYSVSHIMTILDQLLDHLQIRCCHLVATSLTGVAAFRYAATKPERLLGLVLVNSGGLPRTPSTNPTKKTATCTTRRQWKKQLKRLMPHSSPDPQYVDMIRDMNKGRPADTYIKNYATETPEETLRAIARLLSCGGRIHYCVT